MTFIDDLDDEILELQSDLRYQLTFEYNDFDFEHYEQTYATFKEKVIIWRDMIDKENNIPIDIE